MTDYGRGSVLGTATTLPATSAFGLLFMGNMHPLVIIGFCIIMLLSLVILIASVSRYLINSKSKGI